MMDTTAFWKLIEDAKQRSSGDLDQQVTLLIDALTNLEAPDIVAFDARCDHFMALSYTRELWAAAYIINGGCSNDCFDYFRGWLIAQGKAVFQNALRDPETLVDIVEPEEAELESMLYVGQEAYERKTGRAILPSERGVWQLNDELWDEQMKYAMYPKLAEKFG
jgi:hypothetical protein